MISMRIRENILSQTIVIFLYAGCTFALPPQVLVPQQCIAEKSKNFNYVHQAHCYKPRTLAEINKKMERQLAFTNIPSCSEVMLLLHEMNRDSEHLSLDEFHSKYVNPIGNHDVSVLHKNHALFKNNSDILKSGLLNTADLDTIDRLARQTSDELKNRITTDIKKVGLNETKQLLKKSLGKYAHVLPLSATTPEEFLKEFTTDNIKNSILKHLVSFPTSSGLELTSLTEFIKYSSTKSWIKESYTILTTRGATTGFQALKNTLTSLRLKMSPNLALNIVTIAYPFLIGSENFNWIESKDEVYSLLHQPLLFSSFATNTDFRYKDYTCEKLYTQICNYYYSFACDASAKSSRVQHSFLLNYAKLRSHGPFMRESNKLKKQYEGKIQQDNARVAVPVPHKDFNDVKVKAREQ